MELGLLFQILDDVLDLYGDKLRGERGSDLREGKVSAVVATHLSNHPADTTCLLDTLTKSRQQTTTEEIAAWAEQFRTSGTLLHLQHFSTALVGALEQHPLLKSVPLLADSLVRLGRTLEGKIREMSTLHLVTENRPTIPGGVSA